MVGRFCLQQNFYFAIMFGFTAQFCETDIQKSHNGVNNETCIEWKSINQLAAIVRQIGKKLRILDQFDDGLNELIKLIQKLFNNYESHPISTWIENNTFQRVNDLIFGKIQTISYPFLNNKQSEKSLKTSIETYYNFTNIITQLLHKHNHPPLIIFTKNQRKAIYKLHSIIINHKNESKMKPFKQTKLEKEHEFFHNLQSKQNDEDSKETDIDIDVEKYVNSDRIKRAEYVLNNRTDRVLLILDGCYDIHNQYAMLRSAEIFGVQNIWIIRPIEYRNIDICNRISKSSQQWLSVRFFTSTNECIQALKSENGGHKHRKVWVMDVGKDAMELSPDIIVQSNLKNKAEDDDKEYVAIVMGKESSGPSEEFMDICDKKIFLSQFGFCESFNVSVACSIMLNNIFLMYPSMRGDMNENDRNKLRKQWYYQLIHDEEIQKKLDVYLNGHHLENGETLNGSKTEINIRYDGKDTFHKAIKHKNKINHDLRNKIESDLQSQAASFK